MEPFFQYIAILDQRVSRSLRSLTNKYVCIQKNIVIERIRDLIYLKFVATDFFQIVSPTAGENSVDSAYTCYSALSALLTNPLPDLFNYSSLLPHSLPHSGHQSFTSLFSPLPSTKHSAGDNTSLLQRFTAESSQELRRNAVPSRS